MAWFDYAAALGDALGQGVSTFRAQQQQQRMNAQQDRQEAERRRQEALELLALEDPENVSADWIQAHPEVARQVVTRAPTGQFRLRESPMAALGRQAEKAATEDKVTTANEKAQARALIASPTFKQLPLPQRLRALELVGASPQTVRAYLTKDEQAEAVEQSPEGILQRMRDRAADARLGRQLAAQKDQVQPEETPTVEDAVRLTTQLLSQDEQYQLMTDLTKRQQRYRDTLRLVMEDLGLTPKTAATTPTETRTEIRPGSGIMLVR